MESLLNNPLEILGIPSVVAGLLYLILTREAFHRKEKRDAQVNALSQENKETKEKLKKHLEHHGKYEKDLYDKVNTALAILHELQGYIRGRDDKSK
ncbi:MAG: hypothetical protein LBC87_04115 [Fibromonadaceae bacterium]|nr:hypothetical protein [Fibromonadaceae bacterium]